VTENEPGVEKKTRDQLRPLTGFTRSVAPPPSPLARKFLEELCFAPKVILMRYRARVASIASAKISQERSRAHRRTLALIVTIACIPLLGTVLAIALTSKPDLSGLVPSNKQVGDYTVLSWRELLQAHHELSSAVAKLDGTAVQALGYMVDGDKSIHPGDFVQDFVLLPDAGNLLDPADRFGDQMVSVRIREGNRIPFSPRQLVWVWGTFRTSRGDPSGSMPLYHLECARAQPADRADIARYFQ
jgi:hypothetical protein